jgi:tetratricopeptide (TPR) repeat protein
MRLRTLICFHIASSLAVAILGAQQASPADPSGFAKSFTTGTETRPPASNTPASNTPASNTPASNTPASNNLAKPELTPEMRGDIFMARKMFREAAEMYLQMPQSSPIAWNKVGIAYHQLGQLGLAKRAYEKSVRLSPKYAEAINNLGTIAYAEKSYRRATSQYKKALAHAPDSASIHSNLGTALFARKKYLEAAVEYKKALSLDANVFEHKGSQGTVLQERSVEERAKFHYELAKLYAKSGQPDRALQYLRKSLEEGFNERKKIPEEEAFAELRLNPEFQAILSAEIRVL